MHRRKQRLLSILLPVALLLSLVPAALAADGTPGSLNGDSGSGDYELQKSSVSSETNINGGVYYQEDSNSAASRITVQEVDGENYLFLPSSADYTKLGGKLRFTSDATLSGTVTGKTLKVTPDTRTLDLTSLFVKAGETMTAGTEYPLTVKANNMTQRIILMRSDDLSSLYITMTGEDGQQVSLDTIHADKKTKAVTGGDVLKVSSDGATEASAALKTLKGRGNTSWTGDGDSADKKPYTVKLKTATELVPEAGAAKNWCLVSNNWNEKTGLANSIIYWLDQQIGGASAVQFESVDLYINGEYRGTYLLTEKIEIDEARVDITETEYAGVSAIEDEDSTTLVVQYGGVSNVKPVQQNISGDADIQPRTWEKASANATNTITGYASQAEIAKAGVTGVSVDPAIAAGIQAYKYATNSSPSTEGGWLLEIDCHYYEEASWFITRRGVTVVVKDPEYASRKQVQEIAAYVQAVEDALYADSGCVQYNGKLTYYADLLDITSLAKQYLLDALSGQSDQMWSSSFMYLDRQNGAISGKLTSGPVWDYDIWGRAGTRLVSLYSAYGMNGQRWSLQLLSRGDFVAELNSLLEGTFGDALTESLTKIDELESSLSASLAMNAVLYEEVSPFADTYKSSVDLLLNTKFSSGKLRGVTVTRQGGTLTAVTCGDVAGYQWYRLDTSTGASTAIRGATGRTYTPTAAGTYYVRVTAKDALGPVGAGSVMYAAPTKLGA